MTHVFAKIAVLTVLASLAVSTSLAVGPNKLLGEKSKKAAFRQTKAAIGTCTLTAKSDTTLTCTKNSDTFTIVTDDKTQFRRRFWGKSSLDELTVGDVINVIGVWTDEAHTSIRARLIRDTSIQLRFGVFFGNVTSVNADGWIMSTIKRGNQTVTVDSDTKFTNRREETIVKSDVAVGHRVRVKGLWNFTTNTLTDVDHVKDFSLPAQAGLPVQVTVTATPTP